MKKINVVKNNDSGERETKTDYTTAAAAVKDGVKEEEKRVFNEDTKGSKRYIMSREEKK